jgi:uncharacterized protein YndB with AHSA1/START domain
MTDATLVITRNFDAPVEDVFDAWVSEVAVKEWYGPEGFTNTIHAFNAKEGGAYSLTMHGPDGDHPLTGVFKTIDRPNKLVFTWQWKNVDGNANDGKETLVTVEFKKSGKGTAMKMTHSGFISKKTKEMHNIGWSSSFNRLEKMLT